MVVEKCEEVENLSSYSRIPIKGEEEEGTNNKSINNNESLLVV